MMLCRFDNDRLGLVDGDTVRDVTAALDTLPRYGYPLPRFDPLIANLAAVRKQVDSMSVKAQPRPWSDVKLLSPVANPGKILAAPVNYRKHLEEARTDPGIHHQKQVEEIQKMGLFLKATSSVVGPGEGVALRHLDRRNDHEVELAVIVGKSGSRISRAEAFGHVAAYCIGFDMTVRGPEERSLRKSVDSFTVLGPWLVTADALGNPSELDLRLSVNGEMRQQANTRDLILAIPELIEFATSFYTLHPGDVLLTGTPEGVGPVKPGDRLVAEIQGIGRMEVAVRAAT
ncbi:MAG TPA: fumarylacetoacetate hydrolase family protein [Burkholderiales bacterium]|nr:fumarylacetoacetate hydrolase family protein [Burkholderiales bacterium]